MPITRPQAEQEFGKWFTNRPFTNEDLTNAQTYGLGIYEASANEIRNRKRPGDGPDMTGWPESMKQMYEMYKSYIDTLKQSGKVVNPNITIDEATLSKFAEQAKTELGPYYQDIFKKGQTELDLWAKRAKEDYATQEAEIGRAFGKDLEGLQNNMAGRGLAFSSERDKSEADLAAGTNRQLTALQQQYGRAAEDTANSAVNALGSRNVNFSPSIETGGTAQIGTPGRYSLSGGTGTRSLAFTPSGITGSTEWDQKAAEKARVNELTANERMIRGYNTV